MYVDVCVGGGDSQLRLHLSNMRLIVAWGNGKGVVLCFSIVLYMGGAARVHGHGIDPLHTHAPSPVTYRC